MRYIRRFDRDRAIIARLTVWRRLLLSLVLVFASTRVAPVLGVVLLLGAAAALVSAVHVAWLKVRMIAWP